MNSLMVNLAQELGVPHNGAWLPGSINENEAVASLSRLNGCSEQVALQLVNALKSYTNDPNCNGMFFGAIATNPGATNIGNDVNLSTACLIDLQNPANNLWSFADVSDDMSAVYCNGFVVGLVGIAPAGETLDSYSQQITPQIPQYLHSFMGFVVLLAEGEGGKVDMSLGLVDSSGVDFEWFAVDTVQTGYLVAKSVFLNGVAFSSIYYRAAMYGAIPLNGVVYENNDALAQVLIQLVDSEVSGVVDVTPAAEEGSDDTATEGSEAESTGYISVPEADMPQMEQYADEIDATTPMEAAEDTPEYAEDSEAFAGDESTGADDLDLSEAAESGDESFEDAGSYESAGDEMVYESAADDTEAETDITETSGVWESVTPPSVDDSVHGIAEDYTASEGEDTPESAIPDGDYTPAGDDTLAGADTLATDITGGGYEYDSWSGQSDTTDEDYSASNYSGQDAAEYADEVSEQYTEDENTAETEEEQAEVTEEESTEEVSLGRDDLVSVLRRVLGASDTLITLIIGEAYASDITHETPVGVDAVCQVLADEFYTDDIIQSFLLLADQCAVDGMLSCGDAIQCMAKAIWGEIPEYAIERTTNHAANILFRYRDSLWLGVYNTSSVVERLKALGYKDAVCERVAKLMYKVKADIPKLRQKLIRPVEVEE